MTGTLGDGTMPTGNTRIGINLLNHHPISFVYDAALATNDGELVAPTALASGPVRLYEGGTPGVRNTVQCSTCHDPHSNAIPKFLRLDPRGTSGNLCVTCHVKPGWSGSAHQSTTKTVTIGGVGATVATHSCFACHTPHAPLGAQQLLRAGAASGISAIEQTCYQCHQALGPGKNLQGEFTKTSRHAVASVATAGRHRPVFIAPPLPENVLLRPGIAAPRTPFVDALHVECVDCHNPHRATAANPLEGMPGISITGAVIPSVRNDSSAAGLSEQYAGCLRCHGTSFATALPATLPSGLVPRNKHTEFQPANSSFHPVAARGRNRSTALNAQLTPNGLSVNAMIRCTDCHNSEAFATTTGRVVRTPSGAPSGPHGSARPSILRANYRSALGVTFYSSANFALCFSCHSETALRGTSSNFFDFSRGTNLHDTHLTGSSNAICASCHFNIHSNVAAATTQYNINGTVYTTPPPGTPTRLVAFHPNVLGAPWPRPEWWINTVTRERGCNLECHGRAGEVGGGRTMDAGENYTPSAAGDLPP